MQLTDHLGRSAIIRTTKRDEDIGSNEEIRIKSGIRDMESLMGILLNNGYAVSVKAIMKEYPCSKSISYYSVQFKQDIKLTE